MILVPPDPDHGTDDDWDRYLDELHRDSDASEPEPDEEEDPSPAR